MITVDAKELFFALSFLKDIAPTNPHIAEYEYAHFVPSVGGLEIRAVDRGKYGSFVIGAETDKDLRTFLVPLVNIHRLVGALRQTENDIRLELTASGKSLNVISEDDTAVQFRLRQSDFFPEPPNIMYDASISVEPAELVEALSVSAFAQHESIILQSLHLKSFGTELVVEATNTVTGGRKTIETEGNDFDVAVPASVEKPLNKMLNSAVGTWELGISKSHLVVENPHWTVAFQVLEQKYFDLDRLYSNSAVNVVEINREELLTHIKVLSSVLVEPNIRFEVHGDRITMGVVSELGEAERTMIVEGANFTKNFMVVHLVQLQKILQLIKDEVFTITIGNQREPILFHSDSGNYFTLPR